MSSAPAAKEALANGIIFVDYDLDSKHEPQLIFRSLDSNESNIVRLRYGDQISWKILQKKYCIGYHSRDEYHHYEPCPKANEIEIGTQCGRCKSNDVLFPCMICDGSKCHAEQRMKDICDVTPTSIYVTIFDTYLKVGVSKKERLTKRWIEQGADLASEIAVVPNGMLAREIESRISQTFEISKGVRFNRKVNSMRNSSPHNSDEHARTMTEEIMLKLETISHWVATEYGSEYARSPALIDLSSNYTLKSDGRANRLEVSKVETLGGIFKGMKGSIFCINSNGVDYMLDIRDLRGHLSKFGDFKAEGVSLNNQKSIAEYFS